MAKLLTWLRLKSRNREDIDPLDEAEAYETLRETGISVTEIARRVDKSRSYISKRLRLLRLHPG